jgi:glycosyltransferase involved in cell wall biosynthesis
VPVKLAIITPVLNSKNSILRCIDSTSNLHIDFTHIFVDGGSTDGTLQLLETLSASDHLLLVKAASSGIYEAMNIGALCAPEDAYLLFLGADDAIISSPPASFLGAVANGHISAAFFPVKQHDLDADKVKDYACELPLRVDSSNFFCFPFHHQGYVVSRADFLAHPLDPSLGVHADYSQMIYFANNCSCGFYNYSWVCYSTGGASDFFSFSNLSSLVKVANINRIGVYSAFLNQPLIFLGLILHLFLPRFLVRFARRLRIS